MFRGGVTALLGAWVALLPDGLGWSGLPFLVTAGVGLLGLGTGAFWAGLDATHLLRYGKSGSPIVHVSVAGLGGSALLWLATFYLLTDGPSALLSVLSLAALAGIIGFGAVLVISTLLFVERMLASDGGD
jgi:hypothetical protein